MTMAQRNSDPVGDPTCGMEPTARENDPNPVRLLRPTKISEPTPAASSPGTSTISIIGPPKPSHLHEEEGADERRAQQRGDGGEAPGGADHHRRHRGGVALEQVHRENAEPAADGDQRRLWAQDDAEAQRGERGGDDAEELDRGDRAAGLEALRGLVAARAGEEADGQRDREPR